MKNRFWASLAIIGLVILSSCAVHGVVAERPADVVYERPVSPGPGFVWVDGDWRYENGRYNWHEGYWDNAHQGREWHKGNWEQTHDGWKWHKGSWK